MPLQVFENKTLFDPLKAKNGMSRDTKNKERSAKQLMDPNFCLFVIDISTKLVFNSVKVYKPFLRASLALHRLSMLWWFQ